MERGNTTHGPVRDEEMAREAESIVRGAPQRAHSEEWRQSEPLDEAEPTTARPEDTMPLPSGRDLELCSELARVMTRDIFPAGPGTLSDRLDDAGAPEDLVDRVSRLPEGRRFGSVHEVPKALGISSPEHRAGRGSR
jgi:hypothetical protein